MAQPSGGGALFRQHHPLPVIFKPVAEIRFSPDIFAHALHSGRKFTIKYSHLLYSQEKVDI